MIIYVLIYLVFHPNSGDYGMPFPASPSVTPLIPYEVMSTFVDFTFADSPDVLLVFQMTKIHMQKLQIKSAYWMCICMDN